MRVRYPEIRERLRIAACALSDEELHERLWIQGQRRSDAELGFNDALLVFVDELDMFGAGDLIGNVLADAREENAVAALQESIHALIDEIGNHGSIGDAIATGATWQRCRKEAGELERLLRRRVPGA